MSTRTLCLVGFTAILGSAAGACSAAPLARPAASSANAVECPGTTLRSDAELSAYAHCSSVRGDLRIEQAGVTDLSALAGLQQVSGTLSIAATTELVDLTGLEQLSQVGALEITGNKGLEHTTGLGNLTQVGKLVVTSNPKLVSLAGLKSLKHAKSVDISKNRVLAGYFGLLPQLAQVEQELVLRQNLGLSKQEVSQVMARIPQRQGTQAAGQGKLAAVQ